ncbi:MAG: hypothetical protein ACLR2O_00270 [Coprococcus sp.]
MFLLGEGEPSESGNENSLVLHLQYGKITMLFTGDLENTGEELLTERIKNLRKKENFRRVMIC